MVLLIQELSTINGMVSGAHLLNGYTQGDAYTASCNMPIIEIMQKSITKFSTVLSTARKEIGVIPERTRDQFLDKN
jgi:hypothetical protein